MYSSYKTPALVVVKTNTIDPDQVHCLNWVCNIFHIVFARTSSFTDKRGKQLRFSVKGGSAESILWKGTVRVQCEKVSRHSFQDLLLLLYCNLTSKSTSMVMLRRSVNLTTLFLSRLRPKRLTNT